MFISFIIPTYNSSKTIEFTLNSILAQTFQDFEIILIDNLSTDETLSLAKGYHDERIYCFSSSDFGIYDAMNKGIKASKGIWSLFLGSDDRLYDKDVLQRIVPMLKSTSNNVIYGNALVEGDAGWAKDGELYDGPFDLKKLLRKNICHQAMFYRSEILKQHQFNIKYKVCADYDLNLKLYAKHKFQFINQTIAVFKGGGESSSGVDPNFNLSESIITAFYKLLYQKEFSFIKKEIRVKARSAQNVFEKLYLNTIYLKHKLTSA